MCGLHRGVTCSVRSGERTSNRTGASAGRNVLELLVEGVDRCPIGGEDWIASLGFRSIELGPMAAQKREQ